MMDIDDKIEEIRGNIIKKEDELIAIEWYLKGLEERIKELDEEIAEYDRV